MEIMQDASELDPKAVAAVCEGLHIDGVIAQSARVQLARGQTMWASRGSLLAYSESVDWELRIPGGSGKAVSRVLAGEGLSLTWVTAKAPRQEVLLAANQTGRLLAWDLSRGSITCAPGAFLAAIGDVDIDVTVARSAGAAFFGGAGLFLQRLSGRGIVLIQGAGDFIPRQLGAGERLLVSTGNLAAFSSEVGYDVTAVGGCLRTLFGGEGLFMTKMKGPGWVLLQSLKRRPVAR